MLRLKSCGHCLGDLFEEEFLGECELVCLQCGNRVSGPGLMLAPVRVHADPIAQIAHFDGTARQRRSASSPMRRPQLDGQVE
jgi:hypothetical protein